MKKEDIELVTNTLLVLRSEMKDKGINILGEIKLLEKGIIKHKIEVK